MRTYSDNDPTGNSRFTDFAKRTRAVTQREGQLYSGVGVKIQNTTQGRTIKVPRQFSAPGGWQFQSPIELDVTVGVSPNTVVYISPNNPLAAGSYTDLVSSIVINARSGLWVCVQAVPPSVTVSGVNYYNIPQIPYPGATGGSFGSHPWTGDLDGANVFWAFLAQTPYC